MRLAGVPIHAAVSRRSPLAVVCGAPIHTAPCRSTLDLRGAIHYVV